MTAIVLFLYRVFDSKHFAHAYETTNFAPAFSVPRLRVIYLSISPGNGRGADQGLGYFSHVRAIANRNLSGWRR